MPFEVIVGAIFLYLGMFVSQQMIETGIDKGIISQAGHFYRYCRQYCRFVSVLNWIFIAVLIILFWIGLIDDIDSTDYATLFMFFY